MTPDESDPIERAIEFALRPRIFIRDGQCIRFVKALEEVAGRIDALIPKNPDRVVCRTRRTRPAR